MSLALRDQLQSSLGSAYVLGRELGGGGMSCVFLALDTELERDVVVKVLSSEVAAGVSAERFEREIRLVALLQEPHIVPVYAAGITADGLPYYTMPFVRGESLRVRLSAGPIPLEEAVDILRDVLRALAHAHAHGIVHRDIKPENVLLSSGSAMVTDFGIAKALRAAMTMAPDFEVDSRTLTAAGMSLGTPAYMAPEQAMADPATDHRADLYAWGVVAYEALAGRHPFSGRSSPQALMAAHLTEPSPPLPATVPPALAAVVLHTLVKDPDERPHSAAAVLTALDAAREHTARETGRASALLTRAGVLRALGVYALTVLLVIVGTPRLMDVLGLPDWVLPGAFGLIALGFPLVLAALYFRHQALQARAATHGAPGDAKISHAAAFSVRARSHLRLSHVAWGGAAAFGAFALLVAIWMTLRALGIGPAGSLFAAGALNRSDTLVVADFHVTGGDTALGPVMAEAVRTDLSQSRVIRVAAASQVVAALRRMQRDPTQPFGEELAGEVAQREGMGAVVAGELTPLGTGYIVTLKLLAASTGDVLASFQETAGAPDALISTVQHLTRKLRGKIGESLTAVRADPPLDQVTTASLPALRKYTAGSRAYFDVGDCETAVVRLREALALDSTFAMAYNALANSLWCVGLSGVATDSALTRAYRYRERLPEIERLLTTANYFGIGPGQDRQRAAAAYETVLALDPTNSRILDSYAELLLSQREFARVEAMLRRADSVQSYPFILQALSGALAGQGRYAAAESTLKAGEARMPGLVIWSELGILAATDARQSDSIVSRAERVLAKTPSSQMATRSFLVSILAHVALERGQPDSAERLYAQEQEYRHAAGGLDFPLLPATEAAMTSISIRRAPARAVRELDSAFALHPVASLSNLSDMRFALNGAAYYARAGAPTKARRVLDAVRAASDSAEWRKLSPSVARVRAEIAMANGDGVTALRFFREADLAPDGGPLDACATCILPDLALAAETAGFTDSARLFWTRYVEEPATNRDTRDRWSLAHAYRRLGELWEAAGDTERANRYDEAFVALRAHAEPALQPEVDTVRRRLAARKRLVPSGANRTPPGAQCCSAIGVVFSRGA